MLGLLRTQHPVEAAALIVIESLPDDNDNDNDNKSKRYRRDPSVSIREICSSATVIGARSRVPGATQLLGQAVELPLHGQVFEGAQRRHL